jgi:hypothetical protein
MVNRTLAMGHHAETRLTARNFLIFHMIAVRPTINRTLLFVTGEDNIARFDSLRYNQFWAVCQWGNLIIFPVTMEY